MNIESHDKDELTLADKKAMSPFKGEKETSPIIALISPIFPIQTKV
jgi:hypothetical protein